MVLFELGLALATGVFLCVLYMIKRGWHHLENQGLQKAQTMMASMMPQKQQQQQQNRFQQSELSGITGTRGTNMKNVNDDDGQSASTESTLKARSAGPPPDNKDVPELTLNVPFMDSSAKPDPTDDSVKSPGNGTST